MTRAAYWRLVFCPVRVGEKTRFCTRWRRRSHACVRKLRSKMISLSTLFSGLLSWGPPAVLGECKMTRVMSIRCEACIVFCEGRERPGRRGSKMWQTRQTQKCTHKNAHTAPAFERCTAQSNAPWAAAQPGVVKLLHAAAQP